MAHRGCGRWIIFRPLRKLTGYRIGRAGYSWMRFDVRLGAGTGAGTQVEAATAVAAGHRTPSGATRLIASGGGPVLSLLCT